MYSLARAAGLLWPLVLILAFIGWVYSEGFFELTSNPADYAWTIPFVAFLLLYWLTYLLAWQRDASPARSALIAIAMTAGMLAVLRIIQMAFAFSGLH